MLDPFRLETWAVLIVQSVLLGLVIRLASNRDSSEEGMGNVAMIFGSNFGIPSLDLAKVSGGRLRGLLFYLIVQGGYIVWVSYQASLTSGVLVTETKLPFSTLEELTESNYEYIQILLYSNFPISSLLSVSPLATGAASFSTPSRRPLPIPSSAGSFAITSVPSTGALFLREKQG